MSHWEQWHTRYDDPDSAISGRLRVVREQITQALDVAAPGPVRVLSMCAGDGRDLLGVLADHPRRSDVSARLVEWNPVLADRARAMAPSGVEVVTGDAGAIDAYAGAVPADLVLTCGVFGNISEGDIAATILAHRSLCAPGATVIWTRHRREPDLVPQILDWFAAAGFAPVWVSEPDAGFGVGVSRFTGRTQPLVPGTHLFTFS